MALITQEGLMLLRVLLVLLAATIGFGVFVSRKRYDVEPFTTPSGRVFQTQKTREWCPVRGQPCFTQVSFEAPSLDSATFRRDAKDLAAAFHEETEAAGRIGVMLFGFHPGRFRLFPPDSGRVVIEVQVARGTWRVLADSGVGKVDWVFGESGLW